MDITPTRRKLEDEGKYDEEEGIFVSTSASSERTLHQSVSSTWTQARFSEADVPSHVPAVGRRDGLQAEQKAQGSNNETRTESVRQLPRPPLPSMSTERAQVTSGTLQPLPDNSDIESSKDRPQPGTAAPHPSPCPTSNLAMPDLTSQTHQEPFDNHPRDSRSSLGPNAGSSHISPALGTSTRTRLPPYLVSDNPDTENDGDQPHVHSTSHSNYVSTWTPPSSPSFPDSDSESVSSFPSVSSSFFFSSAAASPHLVGISDAHQTPEDPSHPSGSGGQAVPSRRRSRQALHPGGYPRTGASSRAHSRGRTGHAVQAEHTSSLENLPHSQKPIPLPNRKGAAHVRPSNAKGTEMDLAIPTLSLPAALPRPTQSGQALGHVRVILLSDSQNPMSGSTPEAELESVVQTLIWDNQDILDVGDWEPIGGESESKVQLHSLHASTDWSSSSHTTPHSHNSFYSDEKSEKFEGTRNVEIVRVSGISSSSPSLGTLTARLKRLIMEPFHDLSSLLLPSISQSFDPQEDDGFDVTTALARLLASSSSTPLFTAMVVVADTNGPGNSLKPLLQELSSVIPIIMLPRTSHTHPSSSRSRRQHSITSSIPKVKLSEFTPNSSHSLFMGIFRTPETLRKLRMESVERFLKWREVEGEVTRSLAASSGIPLSSSAYLNYSITSETQHPLEIIQTSNGNRVGLGVRVDKDGLPPKWQEWKQQWETEWMESFSVDVASRLRDERRNEKTPTQLQSTFSGAAANQSRKRTRARANEDDEGMNDNRPSSPSSSFVHPPSPLTNSTTLPSDPLHLPSLILLSLSLLGPLKQRLGERIKGVFAILWDNSVNNTNNTPHNPDTCLQCGSTVLQSVSKREHERGLAPSRAVSYHHGNSRLVLVGIGGLMIGVGIGLYARG